MAPDSRSTRRWIERIRRLRERATREREGMCYVEGIRQVLSAFEGGHDIVAVLVDPARLRSDVAWEAIAHIRDAGSEYVELKPAEFERISSRDNPVGIAAIVHWRPGQLIDLTPVPTGLYLLADDVRDPGNLGTITRTLDAAGGAAIVVHAGTDPAHPNALRASLGTTFRMPAYTTSSLDAFFDWATAHQVTTLATSASAESDLWDMPAPLPLAILVGNEGEGLGADTIARCDQRVRIPMLGTATSLNVSVAAGIILYEARRGNRE